MLFDDVDAFLDFLLLSRIKINIATLVFLLKKFKKKTFFYNKKSRNKTITIKKRKFFVTIHHEMNNVVDWGLNEQKPILEEMKGHLLLKRHLQIHRMNHDFSKN